MGIPFKDKQVGLIVERHNLGTKNLPPNYIEPPRVLPPVGWGALDGRDVAETRVWRKTWGRKGVDAHPCAYQDALGRLHKSPSFRGR